MDSLDSKAICAIINACHKASVKELKLGDLCVTFATESTQSQTWELPKDARGKEIPFEDLAPQTLMTSEQREVLRQIDENQLMIDDPIAFEQRMIDLEMQHPRAPYQGEVGDMDA